MSELSELEQRVVDFLNAKKSSLGLVRVLRGEPMRVETPPCAFVSIQDCVLARTDEKYGRMIVTVAIVAFTGPLPEEKARDATLDLGQKIAVAFLKDPTLKASGSPFALNLRIADIKPRIIPGSKGESLRSVTVLLEIAVDQIDIEVSW